MRAAHAVEARDVAAITCLTSRGIEPAAIFCRAVRIGVDRATTEEQLDAALAHMSGHGRQYVVPVAPQSRPATLASWLEGRGFTRGYAWMKFYRSCEDAPQVVSDLEVRAVGAALRDEFGRIAAEGFGLPRTVIPWLAALVGRANWICAMALADGSPVAVGAVYLGGEHAWLGLGATLASHRRRGAQNALLALRLREAAVRGARVAVTETGERVADKPSGSYRNILRAGFEEAYLRQNYLSPS